MPKKTQRPIPRNENFFDDLTLQISEIMALSELIEAIGTMRRETAGLTSDEPLFEGCAAVARVINDKLWIIRDHAETLNGGAR